MKVQKYPYPHDSDLRRLVRFSSEDGTIWLAEHRMLLLHAAALGSLRKELINSVGLEQARRILTRMGFASGTRDAELAKKIRAGKPVMEAFLVGPQLHMLEGSVRVTPIKLEMDITAGKFYGELRWDNSWEAEAHVREFGPQTEPICWMLLGYASGYTTEFMSRFVLFKEVACVACGTDHCTIVGKPVEEWPDADEHTRYYESDSIVSKLLELRTEVDVLRSSLEQQYQIENLIGESSAFRRTYDLVAKAAGTNVTVLLTGETGVGKERFARALHDLSGRRDGPFVAVNCAALPDDLVESELFGVEKGAFTGAHASRAGKFERADGGTIFLDEIGDMPLPAQAKLLRVLQEGEIERLGDERTRKVNVRVVAATNANLEASVKAGRFRSDLFYRLNVYPIAVPPLRERTADIPTLAKAMLQRFGTLHGKRFGGITDKAMKALSSFSWPGNIRELENMIERGVILAPNDGWVELDHLSPCLGNIAEREASISESGHLREKLPADQHQLCDAILSSGYSIETIESMLLEEAVQRSAGNLAGAARLLGLSRPQLSYRLKRNQNTANIDEA
jgi:DNA-binding NtrC family response regulator